METQNRYVELYNQVVICWSIGITISVILSCYKLGIAGMPVLNWSWWVVATPALVYPVYFIVVQIVSFIVMVLGLMFACVFSRQ